MDNPAKLLIGVLAAPLRILLLASFLLLAKAGWLTWLTPEAAHVIVNAIMDWLVVAVPAGYAIWAAIRSWRNRQPETIVAKAAALPEVKEIVAAPEIAAKIDDPAVVKAG